MKDFHDWLTRNGFTYTRGDTHWLNSGWWYPAPPENLSDENPPGLWLWVQEDRENRSVFIDRQTSRGRESLVYTDDPQRAIDVTGKALYELMTEIDDGPTGFSGFGMFEHGRSGRLVGKRVDVRVWDPPFTGRVVYEIKDYVIVRRDDDGRLMTVPVDDVDCKSCYVKDEGSLDGYVSEFPKVCSKCGKKYTEKQWERLPLLGYQTVEADEDGPGFTMELKNCPPPCSSTLAVEVEP